MLNILKSSTRIVLASLAMVVFSALPSSGEEITIAKGKLTLNANLNMVEGKSYADGMMLLLHGTLAHKDMEIMTALQEILLERGISNLAINLSLAQDNRHGMNDCALPQNHLDSNAQKEVSLWVDWLQEQGADKITLLGHSRGGNQVARYLADNPAKAVTGAILVAPPTRSAERTAKSYKMRARITLASVLEKANGLVAAGKGDVLMESLNFVYCRDASVSAASFTDYYTFIPRHDTPTAIKDITVPLLVQWEPKIESYHA